MSCSDEHLAASVTAGDEESYRELFDRLFPLCYAVARRWAPDDDSAVDIVMESFARTWEAMATGAFDIEKCPSFRAWQLRIVTNICIDRARSREPIPLPDTGDPDDGPSLQDVQAPAPSDPDRDPFAGVREAWGHLSRREKAVVQLKFWAGLTWEEVASDLGISVNQARYAAKTAREAIHPYVYGE